MDLPRPLILPFGSFGKGAQNPVMKRLKEEKNSIERVNEQK